MTLSVRTLVLTGIIVFVTGSITGLTGCRTAQESRRGASARGAQSGNTAQRGMSDHAQMDSLRMIQEKLVEVIDSLTSLVGSDHDRIRALEADVAMLRSRIEGTPVPGAPVNERSSTEDERSSPPQNSSAQSYTAPPPPASDDRSSTAASSSVLERYQSALRLYNGKEYTEALAAFESLDADDPHGSYAGNYKYWEGECYYALKEYDRALRRFQNVLDEYRQSSKAPAAEFKIAETYERLGRPATAQTAYERLNSEYPNSEYRIKANARISALARSGASGH